MRYTDYKLDAIRAEHDRALACEARAWAHGAYDPVVLTVPDIVADVRSLAELALRGAVASVYHAALRAAQEPYAAELERVNWAFYSVQAAGVSIDEARATKQRIDAVTRQVAAAAAQRADLALREMALKAAGAWLTAHTPRRPAHKYMLTAERVMRAA